MSLRLKYPGMYSYGVNNGTATSAQCSPESLVAAAASSRKLGGGGRAASATLMKQRVKSINAKRRKKSMNYKNPMRKNKELDKNGEGAGGDKLCER